MTLTPWMESVTGARRVAGGLADVLVTRCSFEQPATTQTATAIVSGRYMGLLQVIGDDPRARVRKEQRDHRHDGPGQPLRSRRAEYVAPHQQRDRQGRHREQVPVV